MRRLIAGLGDWSAFTFQTLRGIFLGRAYLVRSVSVYVQLTVQSLPVVLITGLFIGMVLVHHAYQQFRAYGTESLVGSVSVVTILSELGPVLAAVMLAGRVGSAMAAEIGSMRVTEQLDAMECLGVPPMDYVVGPRLVGCLIAVPLLTIFADVAGILGSYWVAVGILGVDAGPYWLGVQQSVQVGDLFTGLTKSVVFGGLIATIGCHQGFRCTAGAAGVGRAATQSFVFAFIWILICDFLLVVFFAQLRQWQGV
jgi:phospholipid/cholesterol/gamma-HCH transport system permease protein